MRPKNNVYIFGAPRWAPILRSVKRYTRKPST